MKVHLLKILLYTFLTFQSILLFSADRYWVGGTGNWNDRSHWSSNTGGVGGESVPNATDNVIIDANSFTAINQTLTISGSVSCLNLDWKNTLKKPELSGKSTAILNIYGSITIYDSYIDSYTGTISFWGVKNNSIFINQNIHSNITFSENGNWNLLNPLYTSGNIKLASGSLYSNNHAIEANTFDGNGNNARTLDLGTSTVTVNSWLFGTTSNLVFKGSKSKIIVLGDWNTSLQRGNLFYGFLANSDKRAVTIDSIIVTPIKCDKIGKATGTVTVYVSGAKDPFNFKLWKDGFGKQTSNLKITPYTFDSLIVDPSYGSTYSVDVTKGATTVSQSVTYPGTWPTQMSVNIDVTKHVTCALSSCDAELEANPSGGVSPYSYKWLMSPVQIGKKATGLCNNNINCEVTDANGCVVTGTNFYYPGQPGYTGPRPFIFINDPVLNTASCGSQNNGTISIKMTGGMGPRQFKLVSLSNTDNRPYQSDSNFSNLVTNETYTIWAKDSLGCEKKATNDITIGAIPEPVVSASVDTTICADLKVSMGSAVATNCSVIAWTTSGDGTFSSTSIRNPEYTPGTNDKTLGTVTLTITGTGLAGCNSVTDSRIITISKLPTANAGIDQIVCLTKYKFALAGNATNQSSITWTKSGDGTISNDAILSPDYTFGKADTAAKKARLYITAKGLSGCATRNIVDSMDFTMIDSARTFAGNNLQMCKGDKYTAASATAGSFSSLTWTTNGTGTFSNNSVLNPDYTPSIADQNLGEVTLTLKATAYSPCLDHQSSVKLTLSTPPTVNAGNDHTVCFNGQFSITEATQTNCSTLKWATSGDGSFLNDAIVNPKYTPSTIDTTSGSVILKIAGTGSAGCASKIVEDSMVLTMIDSAFAQTGPNEKICKGYTLEINSASAKNYSSLEWTSNGSAGTLSNPSSISTTYTPSDADKTAGSVTLTLTAKGISPCPDYPSSFTVTLSDPPTVEAGADKTLCSKGSFKLSEASQTKCSAVLWSSSGDGLFSLATDIQPTYTPGHNDSLAGVVTLKIMGTGSDGCLMTNVVDSMILTMIDSAQAQAGPNQQVCKGSVLDINSSSASHFSSLLWTSSGSAGTLSSTSTIYTTYTPSVADKIAGTVNLTLTAKGIAPCPDKSSSINVTLFDQPVIDVGKDTSLCTWKQFSLDQTTGSFYNSLTWTTTGDGTFQTSTDLNPKYTPGDNDTLANSVMLKLEAQGTGGCSSMKVRDSLIVQLIDSAYASAGSDQSICKGTLYLVNNASAKNYASLQWTTTGTGTFTDPVALSTTYNPSVADLSLNTVKLKLTAIGNSPCPDYPSEITLTLDNPPTIFAGNDTTVCAKKPFSLATASVSNNNNLLWTAPGGDGLFATNTSQNPVYTPGTNDKLLGKVNLKLTVTGKLSCASIEKSDSLALTMNDPATVDAGADIDICKDKLPVDITDAAATNYSTIEWTSSGTGTFNPSSDVNTKYSPSAADQTVGTVTLTVTAKGLPSCSDQTDSKVVNLFNPVTASSGGDTVICFNNTFTFSNDNATYYKNLTWEIVSGDGSFNFTNALHPKYTPGPNDINNGVALLNLKAEGFANCNPVSSSMTLNIDKGPQIDAGPNMEICNNGTATISGSLGNITTYKSLLWTTAGDGSFNDAASLHPVYTPGPNDRINKSVQLTLTALGKSACANAIDKMTITLRNALTITLNAPSTQVSCYGAWDAHVQIVAGGGDAPYSYLWNNPLITGKDTLLNKGTFVASVTDSKGCTESKSITITEPVKMDATYTQLDNKCYGDAHGQATVAASNGNAPYSYEWSTGDIGDKAINLTAGYKTVTVTDTKNCKIIDSVEIKQPAKLSSNFNITIPSCGAVDDGEIQATGIGGTVVGLYKYLWSTGSKSNTISGLSDGNYALTVTDDNDCTFDTTIVLPDPIPLSITYNIVNVRCYGDSTGSVKANISGGTAPYSLMWSNLNISDSLGHLPAIQKKDGLFIYVVDALGCDTMGNDVVITEPAKFSVGVGKPSSFLVSANTKISVKFKGKHDMVQDIGFNLIAPDGTIVTLSSSPSSTGTPNPPCNFGRNFDLNFTTEALSTLNQCSIHPYPWPVAWTDDNRVGWPENPAIKGEFKPETSWSAINKQDPSNGGWSLEVVDCSPLRAQEEKDSSVWVDASLSFTDKNQYGDDETITFQQIGLNSYINQPLTGCAVTKYKISLKMSTSCYGICDAQAIMFPEGGISPYNYTWSDPSIPNDDTLMLCAGIYSVTATDANGCTAKGGAEITQPAKISANLDSVNNKCFGLATGKLSVVVDSGGVAPFKYKWSTKDGDITTEVDSVAGGKYYLTITDDNNCHQIDSIVVRDSLKVLADIATDSTLCDAGADGAIYIVPYGDNIKPPFSYLWQTGGIKSSLLNLSAGTYSVTVNDKDGCRLDTSATVYSPKPLMFSATTISLPTCKSRNDASISIIVDGGSKPYKYQWKNTDWTADSTRDKIENIKAGTYNLTITDSHDCTKDTSFIITDPLGMITTITTPDDSVKCYGDATASASVSVINGTAPYNYLWSEGSKTNSQTLMAAGLHYVTVSDMFNCSITDSIEIKQPDKITLTTSVIDSVTCNGSSTANFKVSSLGGSKPYSFIWSNATTDSIVNAAPAGNYSVTVTDANSCSNKTSLTITQPSKLVISTLGQFPSQCSSPTGKAYVEANGAQSPYTYLWSNGGTEDTIRNVLAGVYTVTVFDKKACSVSGNITVKDTATLSIKTTETQKSVTCKDRNDGSGNVSISGGTEPINIIWSNGVSSESLTSLLAGTYIVTVTDVNTCKRIDSLVIDESDILVANFDSLKNVNCYSTNNGLLRVLATGGDQIDGYTYNWSNGITDSLNNNLAYGKYSVTVTDATNCSVTASATLTKEVFTAAFNSTNNILCDNTCSGSSIFSPDKSVSKAPYLFVWENGETDSLAKALCVGTNTVTVTDKNGCKYIDSVIIKDLVDPLSVTFDTTYTPCGESKGKAIAHVMGGVKNYEFKWSDMDKVSNAINDSSLLAIPSGNYHLTITDANGCNFDTLVSITDASHLTFATKVVNVLCTPCTGKAIVYNTNASDIASYSYKWDVGSVNDTLYGACKGPQEVKVTRIDDGCINVFRDTVERDKGLEITMNILKPRTCVYNKDASAYVTIKNNIAPVTYNWSNGEKDSMINNVGNGTYKITVTDGNCTLIDSVVFSDPVTPNVTMSSQTVSCFNGSNGWAKVTVNNGTEFNPLLDSIVWNDRIVNPQKTLIANNIRYGTYTATLYYNGECTYKDSVLVDQNSKLTVTWDTTSTTCNANIGKIIAKGNGGYPFIDSVINFKYKYRWHALGMDSFKLAGYDNDTITGLGVDYYVLKVTDSLDCSITTAPIKLDDSGDITISVDSVRFPTCPKLNNGYYRIVPTSANAPFSYTFWKYNTTTTDTANLWWDLTYNLGNKGAADSLSPGNYKYYVSNGSGKNCKEAGLFTIGTNYLAASIKKGNVTCPLQPNGWAKVSASKGLPHRFNPKYRYLWSTGSTNDSIFGIKAGTYSVTVTDSIDCEVLINTVVISNPAPMTVTLPADTVLTLCYSDTAANISPIIAGGFSPYVYDWDGKSSQAVLSAAQKGWHKLTVSDTGCFVVKDSIFVDKKGSLDFTHDTLRTLCGQSIGQITLTVTATAKPVTYLWNNGATDSVIKSLPVDFYSVTVTDALGCFKTDTIKVEDSSTIAYKIHKVSDVHCAGMAIGSAYVSDTIGGTKPYKGILWENEDFTFNTDTLWKADTLRAGIIEVRVFDQKGCTGLERVRILTDSVLSVKFSNIINDVSCPFAPANTGSVKVDADNGKPAYTFTWNTSPQSNLQTLTGLAPGTYTVTVTDKNNCKAQDSIAILKSPLRVDSLKQVNVSCYGLTNASLQVAPMHGLGNSASYIWSTGETTSSISGKGIGKYTVTITETGNTCIAIDSFVITQPTKFAVKYQTIKKTTCRDSSGIVTAHLTGGTKPYAFIWTAIKDGSVVSNDSSFVNYWADYFKFEVTDSKACQFIDTTRTTDTSSLAIALNKMNPASCHSFSDGAITVTGNNGVRPYKFSWQHDATITDSIAKNLKAGSYIARVTDDSTCWRDTIVTVIEPDTIVLSFPYSSKITCYGETDTVVAHIEGGNGNNLISWKKDNVAIATTDTIIPKASIGKYSVSVVDKNGCKSDSSVVITQAKPIEMDSVVLNTGCGSNAATGSAKVIKLTSDYPPVSFKWWDSTTDSNHTDLSKGIYHLTLTDAKKCSVDKTVEVRSDMFDSLKIDTVQMAKCNYNSATGVLAASAYGSVKPYTWAWNTAKNNTSDTLKNLVPGKYYLTVTAKNGCTIKDSVYLPAMFKLEAGITLKDSNQAISNVKFCKSDSITIEGIGTYTIDKNTPTPYPSRNERYLWGVKDGNTDELQATMSNNLGKEIVVKPFQPTTYLLWYSAYGCNVPVKEITMSYYDTLGLNIEIIKDGETMHDTASIIRGYKLQLKPEQKPWFVDKDPSSVGFVSFEWNSYDTLMKVDGAVTKTIVNEDYYLNNGKSTNIEVNPQKSTWYVLVAKTNKNCYERDSVRITVHPDFVIPSGISPNGDGINDIWNLPYLKQFPEAKVTIFNRWGIVVWNVEKDYFNNMFAGKNKDGKDLPLGTYYYLIEFNDEKGTEPRAGSLTIVR